MSKRTRRLAGLALVVGVAGVALVWRAVSAPVAKPKMTAPKPALVAVEQARQGGLARQLSLTGTVTAEAQIGLYAKIEQPIRVITVKEGDAVTKGETLIRLDSVEMDAQLASGRAEQQVAVATLRDVLAGSRPEDIAQAQAALRQAEAAADRAAAGDRNARAIYSGQITGAPRQAIEEAEGKADVARAQHVAAQAALDAARRSLVEVRQIAQLNTPQEQSVNEASGKAEVAAAQADEAKQKQAAVASQLEEAGNRVSLSKSQIEEAEEKVAVAQAQLAAVRPAASNAKAEDERAQALLRIGGLSQEEAERATLRRATAEAQVEAAQRSLKLAEAQVRTSRGALVVAQTQQRTSEHALAAAQTQVMSTASALNTAREGKQLASALLETKASPNQQIAEAEGRVQVSAAQLAAAAASVSAAEKAMRQVQALQQGPLPQRELDEATGRVAETRAAAQAARERVALLKAGATATQVGIARARLGQAATKVEYWQTQLDLCTLKAPISGVVTQRFKDVGDKTDPKQPLLTINQAGRQLVRTSVSDRELAGLRTGLRARVMLDALPGRPIDVTVTNIYPTADPVTRLVPVELLLPPLPKPLADGSFARVSLQTDPQDGLLIAQVALLPQPEGRTAVFVVTVEGKAHRQMVTAVLESDGRALVTTGLEAGAQVVVRGQDGLKEGQPVKVMPASLSGDKDGGKAGGKDAAERKGLSR